MGIKADFAAELPAWQERVTNLIKESGNVKVDEVTISQVYGGMRNVKGLVTDISYVDPSEGIRFRGYTIPEVLDILPKPADGVMPYVGGLYYLFLIGKVPTEEQALDIENEWKARSSLPQFVFDVLQSMPRDSHPMMLFSTAILALQNESVFAQRYREGMTRNEYWQAMLEDSLNLTAKLPSLSTYIYSLKYRDGAFTRPRSDLDWGANFAYMIGNPSQEYMDFARLYFILHSDHESGNASAHATHLAAIISRPQQSGGSFAWLSHSGSITLVAWNLPEIRRCTDERTITPIRLGDVEKRSGHPWVWARSAA
jgi:citrate synthase